MMRFERHGVRFGLALLACAAISSARAEDGKPDTPDLHELARSSSLPRSHKDFSRFSFRPPGDKVIEQPEANRLLFRTPDGIPDGWAERRGNAVIYYDRTGQVIRVQDLGEDLG